MALSRGELLRPQHGFGYTREDVKMVMAPMALEGKEATWSMGDDTPLAPLARAPRPFYGFFRQRFAQVTNPAIDSLRESCVVSLRTRLGPWPHLLDKHAPLPGLVLPSPFLSLRQMAALHSGVYPMLEELPLAELDCTFPAHGSLEGSLKELRSLAIERVHHGIRILLLSDRAASAQTLPIPMAMVTGAVHHALVKAGLRTRVGLAVEAGDCRDPHHMAVLIGYGAGAVCPWLALQTAHDLAADRGEISLLKALDTGLAKIMSKMGISVLDSYRAAQLFDIIGLDDGIVEWCFPGSPSPIKGSGFLEIEAAIRRSWVGQEKAAELPDYGWVRFRRDQRSEPHEWEPQRTKQLQIAVGSARATAPAVAEVPSPLQAWSAFTSLSEEHAPTALRDLLDFRPAGPATLGLSGRAAQQPGSALRLQRHVAGVHQPGGAHTITLAMNQLGGRSNTGEGGEDPAAYAGIPDDLRRFSATE